MELQTHLRATFIAPTSRADIAAVLGAAPNHLVVRFASDADDGRYTLSFGDDTPTGDAVPAWVRECAGVVVDANDDHRIVAFCAPRSLDLGPEDLVATLPPGDKRWYPYVEGIRVLAYRWNGALRLSTSKVVDAYGSRYFRGSPTFGEQFDAAAVGLVRDRLVEGRCYAFVVQSPDTPMVAPAATSGLLHISTVDLASLTPVDDNDDVGVPRPAWEPVGDSWDALVARFDAPLAPSFLGAIVTGQGSPGSPGTSFPLHAKVMHRSYTQARDLVGADRDLARRMMEVSLDAAQRQALVGLLPHMKPQLYQVDQRVHAAVCAVLDAYVAFNVRRQRQPLPQPVYETIKALHHRVYLPRACPRAPLAYGDVDAYVRGLSPRVVGGLCRAVEKA